MIDAISTIITRQQAAWSSGHRAFIEELVELLPEGAAKSEGIMCLISNEVYLREQSGETPRLAEYQSRFPQLADALSIQWAQGSGNSTYLSAV